MKIYRVRLEPEKFRGVMRDDSVGNSGSLELDGTPSLKDWVHPRVYVFRPRLKYGDFWRYWGGYGAIAVAPRAVESVRAVLAPEDELLPFDVDGEKFHFINVVGLTNCIDNEITNWEDGEPKATIGKHAFHSGAVKRPLFKIPAFYGIDTYAADVTRDPATEFKAMVEAKKLTGIFFEEVRANEG